MSEEECDCVVYTQYFASQKNELYVWQQTRLPRTRRTGGTLLHRASLLHATLELSVILLPAQI